MNQKIAWNGSNTLAVLNELRDNGFEVELADDQLEIFFRMIGSEDMHSILHPGEAVLLVGSQTDFLRVEHPGRFVAAERHTYYDNWRAFMDSRVYTAEPTETIIVRWDFHDRECGCQFLNMLVMVTDVNTMLRSVTVEVTEDSKRDIIEWLGYRAEVVRQLWEPFL